MAVYGATFWIGACRERLVSLQLVLRGQIGNHAELIGRELLSDRTQKVTDVRMNSGLITIQRFNFALVPSIIKSIVFLVSIERFPQGSGQASCPDPGSTATGCSHDLS